ncbi:MAG: hypothetical protein LBE22_03725 [Azoarcus sp.]|jgi:hypothetical protein|nr:hypothetical protein [Azoarcus sp.]
MGFTVLLCYAKNDRKRFFRCSLNRFVSRYIAPGVVADGYSEHARVIVEAEKQDVIDMDRQDLEAQLNRLVTGLAEQKIQEGERFCYDNTHFYAEDVAVCLLPSILVLAQHLAEKLGFGKFGYRFALESNPVFPLTAQLEKGGNLFFLQIAPFVQEVFNTYVMAYRHDLLQLFEVAVCLLEPTFSVEMRTNSQGEPSAPPSGAAPDHVTQRVAAFHEQQQA